MAMNRVVNPMVLLKYLKIKVPLVNTIQSGEECSHQEIFSPLKMD
jgi:hypothetical protein